MNRKKQPSVSLSCKTVFFLKNERSGAKVTVEQWKSMHIAEYLVKELREIGDVSINHSSAQATAEQE